MPKTKNPKVRFKVVVGSIFSTVVLVGMTFYYVGSVHADQFDQQIQALQNQSDAAQAQSNALASQASSYQDAVNKLQQQIDGLQQSIVDNQNQSDQLQKQIDAEQLQLEQEKKILGDAIKQMYLDGQVSTLELLASSNGLGDFIDKEQNLASVQDKLKTTVDQINYLKAQLTSQQQQLQSRIADEKNQQDQLNTAQSQQNQLLAYTEDQKAQYDQQIKNIQAQIASVRVQQLAANRRLLGSGSVSVVAQGSCGGGYPADAVSPYGHWGCNYGQDNTLDNWGMFNRECVSYTAWKVYSAYGYMPYWGGSGNANQWPGDADADHIPRGNTPRVGSVAIGTNPYYFGPVGHAMWVEGISGDQVLVSQYNFSAPGQYSEMWISSSLINTFIYF